MTLRLDTTKSLRNGANNTVLGSDVQFHRCGKRFKAEASGATPPVRCLVPGSGSVSSEQPELARWPVSSELATWLFEMRLDGVVAGVPR